MNKDKGHGWNKSSFLSEYNKVANLYKALDRFQIEYMLKIWNMSFFMWSVGSFHRYIWSVKCWIVSNLWKIKLAYI